MIEAKLDQIDAELAELRGLILNLAESVQMVAQSVIDIGSVVSDHTKEVDAHKT